LATSRSLIQGIPRLLGTSAVSKRARAAAPKDNVLDTSLLLQQLKCCFAASEDLDVQDTGVLLIGIQAVISPRDAIEFFLLDRRDGELNPAASLPSAGELSP